MTTARPMTPLFPARRDASNPPARGARHPGAPGLAASIDPMRVLRRHALAIVVSIILGGGLGTVAYFALMKIYPLYSSEVRFEVQPGLQQAGQVGVLDFADDNMVFRIAQTETFMLTSREILGAAMKNSEIKQTQWHKKFLQGGDINYDEAIDDLEEDLRPTTYRSNNLFSLTWRAHNPSDVPIVLNAIAEAYMANRAKRDTDIYTKNLNAFQQQRNETQDEIDTLAREMRELIQTSGMTELEGVWHSAQAIKNTELTRQMADARSYLNMARTSQRLSEDKLAGKLEPTSQDYREAERDPAVMDQITNIQYIKAQYHMLLETRNPTDQLVVEWEQRLRAYESARDVKLKEIIHRNLEAKLREDGDTVERYRGVVDDLDEELNKNQKLLQDLAGNQSEYEALKTRRDNLEAQRTASMQLINEVQLMRLRADASRVRKVQSALSPREPSFPQPEIIIPLGVLVVLGLTVGIVFLRELMDKRVKGASDLAVLPGAHVLGGIPDLDDDPTKTAAAELVVRKHPFSVLAESYRQASTAILPLLDRNGHQTLLLVGGLPGSGTTTVATNLAAAAASSGKKVLVIDANFRRPRLAEAMDVSGEGLGLGDLLTGAATVDQAIVEAGQNISVIPAGTPINRVFDRLNNGTFDGVMAELRGQFDLIIFDAPPAVVAGDAMVLANKVDAAVLVVRAHQEHRGLVARMINRLSDARCELLGVLLNRPRGIAGGYLKKNYATMAEYAGNSPE